jgi:superfamily II DNA or RNA helicase
MDITEKWLGEIGGWAAMKAARGLVAAGQVALQSSEAGLIRGLAGSGRLRHACGLRIRGRTDVDNLCTCPAARRGLICEHSLAAALLTLQPAARPESRPGNTPRSSASRPTAHPPVPATGPKTVKGRYEVFLPPAAFSGNGPAALSVYVKFHPGGEPETSRLAAWLAGQGVEAASAPLSLRGSDLDSFLAALAGHPRVICGKPSGGGEVWRVAEVPVRLPLRVVSADDDEVEFRLENRLLQPLQATQPTGWWLCHVTHQLFRLMPVPESLIPWFSALLRSPQLRPLRWLAEQGEILEQSFHLQRESELIRNFNITKIAFQIVALLEGSLQQVELRLWAEYQGRRWELGADKTEVDQLFPIQDESSSACFYVRDKKTEEQALKLIQAMGFVAGPSRLGSCWRLTGADRVLEFVASDLPRLRRDWQVEEGQAWRAATRGLVRISPDLRPAAQQAGGDWLAMEFAYRAPDGFQLPRSEVLRLMRSGRKVVQGKAGMRYLIDTKSIEEFEDSLQDVAVELTAGGMRVPGLHASYLTGEMDASSSTDLETIQPLLSKVKADLRPYQLQGVAWLHGAAQRGRGVILGDDMGLGKTLQSIALIVTLKLQKPALGPVLVVCPKSLTGNWRQEFERFAPHLRVAVSQGAQRQALLAECSKYDVILTTYQLVVNDREVLAGTDWGVIVLDEASFIRNPDTEAAKALRTLKAGTRVALTGTPVENSVRDLWSICHFVQPGYLGAREHFRERFEQPLAAGMDRPEAQAAAARLRKLVRPLFLRRTKREVLRDLPDKIEQVLWCDPSPAQAEVYRRLLEEGMEEIRLARRRGGQNGARMTLFTVLLRLRQACCDLRLTGLADERLQGLATDDLSGKWPVLGERLDEIVAAGGKVLIFSQFVQYLRLVRAELERRGEGYAYLDGSSQDREEQVRAFQTDPEKRVFLISLKAGGYGLNLTAADHVILLDPWWNPAVEAQAIDRAHRMGQERVVTATRLALRGTVEERILALQARKRGLVEAALDDQAPLMQGLQDEDLEQLLEVS